jgi:hypothetical protein
MEEDMPEYGVYTEEMDIVFNQDELHDSSNEDVHANANVHSRSKDLTPTQRQQIYEALLEISVNEKLRKNSTKRVAELFNVQRSAVWRIWKRAKECHENGIPVDISSRKPKNSGRKKVQVDLSQVQTIPLRKRSTLRSLAQALGADKSTLHRLFKHGLLRRHSNTIKPYLTESNKKERLRWCVAMLDTSTLHTQPKFVEMDNIIHLDEKWYNATKKNMTYYLYPAEEELGAGTGRRWACGREEEVTGEELAGRQLPEREMNERWKTTGLCVWCIGCVRAVGIKYGGCNEVFAIFL